jgi:hypothetical protein
MTFDGAEAIDFLRASFAGVYDRLDRIDQRLDELTLRVGSLEREMASTRVDIAGLSLRIDYLDKRVARIANGWTLWRQVEAVENGLAPVVVVRLHAGSSTDHACLS